MIDGGSPSKTCFTLNPRNILNPVSSQLLMTSQEVSGQKQKKEKAPPSAELRDGPVPAPDLPEGSDGEDGVVADSGSGYVAR